MHVFDSPEVLLAAVGTELGVSEWRSITQEDVDTFADLTADHQWIHVSPPLASQSPLGGTVAHGFFTLGLVPIMAEDVYRYENFAMTLNYGANKLRFPSPLLVGSRIRGSFYLAGVTPIAAGHLVQVDATVEVEDSDKPVCYVPYLAAALIYWLISSLLELAQRRLERRLARSG